MNTDAAIKYLNYHGPIWLNRIEFTKKERCGRCDDEKATNHE